MSDFQRQINQRIEAFVAEITELARQHAIDSISRALEATQGGRPAGRPAKKNGARRVARGGKRSPDQVQQDADRLLAHVIANPGARAEEIAAEMGMTTKEIALPMRKLVGSKKVKTEGQKRATRYYPTRKSGNSQSRKKRSK